MAGQGLAILAGLLGGLGGVGQAVAGERKQEEDRVLKLADLAERKRQFDEGRFTDFSSVADSFPEEIRRFMPTGRVPTAMVAPMVEQARKTEELGRERQDREALAGAIRARAGTPDQLSSDLEGVARTPGTPPVAESEFLARLASIKTVSPELYKRLAPEEQFTVAPPGAGSMNKRTGEITGREEQADPGPAPFGYKWEQGINANGQISHKLRPLNAMEHFAASQTVQDPKLRNLHEQAANYGKLVPITEGGSVIGGANIATGRSPASTAPTTTQGPTVIGPGLVQGAPKPYPDTAAQDIRGMASVRVAAQSVQNALRDPAVQNYIGPYAQHRSTVQGMAPNEMLGKIPPAVVDLEQNLRRIQNYTIKLITGAQMSQQEAVRIMGELPNLGLQPDVLTQRLKNTLRNISQMEQITRDLVLRGDARAQSLAKELGLSESSAQSVTPVPAPGAAGWTIKRVQ